MNEYKPYDSFDDCLDSCTALGEEQTIWCMAAAAAAMGKLDLIAIAAHRSWYKRLVILPLYEALLQTYLFAGFPAALQALDTLAITLEKADIAFSPPPLEPYNVDEFRRRGEELCAKVYTSAYQPMRERLKKIMPQLDDWMIVEGYGKVLSRPGLSILQRELITVSILTCGKGTVQLFSHLRGALNVGATQTQCEEAIQCVQYMVGKNRCLDALEVLRRVLQPRTATTD